MTHYSENNEFVPAIRLATESDAGQITDIYAPIVSDTIISFEWESPTADEMRGRIENTLERFPWLVYEPHGSVLGYAYAGAHRSRGAYQSGYWQLCVAGLLVRAACRSMTGIASSLHHRNCHSGIFDPVQCEPGQCGSDAAFLVVGVNGNHVDLTIVTLAMKLDRHEANRAFIYLSDPHLRFLPSANVLHRLLLTCPPAVRVEAPVDLGANRLLNGCENRRPRPQREVNHHVSVSIFKWSNLWLDKHYVSTLAEARFLHRVCPSP